MNTPTDRDARADLELIARATPGEWGIADEFPNSESDIGARTITGPDGMDIFDLGNNGCESDPQPDYVIFSKADCAFIAESRTGWQWWIERAEKLEAVLRSLASYYGAGGYNADTVEPDVFERKIRDGVEAIVRVEVERARGPQISDDEEKALLRRTIKSLEAERDRLQQACATVLNDLEGGLILTAKQVLYHTLAPRSTTPTLEG